MYGFEPVEYDPFDQNRYRQQQWQMPRNAPEERPPGIVPPRVPRPRPQGWPATPSPMYDIDMAPFNYLYGGIG